MGRLERAFVIWAIGYLAVYVAAVAVLAVAFPLRGDDLFLYFIPFHVLGMVQNFAALVLMIRDLYRRDFPNPNSKLTWLLLILFAAPISWVLYLYWYGLRPRPVRAGGEAFANEGST